ncbi:MAG: hypothetical protein AB8B65_16525 [Kordia sp.]|uniref:hypothetical protein n=1 Tax=Kordia sp. TaxID=1965332 RepID=UPI00385B2FC6
MAEKNRTALKSYFETGDRPTQDEFGDLVDSAVNKQQDKANLTEALTTNDTKYITPKTANHIVDTAVPNATISTKGKVELATLTEVTAGTDNTRAVTPEGAKRAAEVHAPVTSVNGDTGAITINVNDGTSVGSVRNGIIKFFTGSNSNLPIFHLKLPYRVDTDNKMFHLRATGYSYGSSDIIDVTWVGYCYTNGSGLNRLRNTKTGILNSTAITAGQYIGSDDHIYLWFKTPSTYFTTFRVDSMRVGNGSLLEEGDVEMIMSLDATL